MKNYNIIITLLLILLLIVTPIFNTQAEEPEIEEPEIEEPLMIEKEEEITEEEKGITENSVEEIEDQVTAKKAIPSVEYTSHVQTYGWLETVKDGAMSGTTGKSKRMEALMIKLSDTTTGNIEYISYVQSYGWESSWKKDGEITGTYGEAKRLEAIKIRLTGELSNLFDIYYRVHTQTYGWLPWAKNGQTSGTIGLSKRLEAIEVKIVEKKQETTSNTYQAGKNLLNYTAHMQSYGWLQSETSGYIGISGESKRMEAFKVYYSPTEYAGTLQYMSYIEGLGWETEWKQNGQVSGTEGKSKKIEQIKMKLIGDIASYYDVYYRVHVQGFGWLGWAKNGESAGTEKLGFRIECLEIKIVKKGTGEETGKSLERKDADITYSAHIRSLGDQVSVAEGKTIGTTGKNLRMEALTINLSTELEGNILYKTYVDGDGWEDTYRKSGELSGTTGQSKGIQLLRIKLDGVLAERYDIYYRIHTETFGWMSWARNDEITGADCYDIQAIQIRLYLKVDSSKNLLDRSLIYTQTGFYKENGYTYYKDKNGNQATDWIHIMDKKYFFNSLGIMIGKNVKKVMDISAWQGDIDWNKVKKEGDLDGVILRIAAGCDYEDSKLARNIKAIKEWKIPYGIYIYSYAENKQEGIQYANFTIDVIKKYSMNPKIGIFFDLESNKYTEHLTTKEYEEIVSGYMDTMFNKGYGNLTRIYTYKSLAEEKLNTSYLYNKITWIAHYNHFNRYVNENVVGWQYSSQEQVPGVPGTADMSVWFTDF